MLCSVGFSQAQRGKITGVVIDEQTKEPLISTNVFIEGTTLGAATDLEGRYVILNVPPGTYSVTASMIGYAKVTQTGVGVYIDRTTEVNFRLRDATIQVQEVVVVAERPKIIKDQTSTAQTLDDAQIRSAPIEGLRGALDLAASFQKNAQGNYSIRGSGSYELNFQINGVEQINSSTSAPGAFATDKANNSWKYDVNPLGVQQVQLISGGFSAEYGNAQAGVVKVVTKEGTPQFKGEVRVEYRPPGQYHFGNFIYDHSNYEWQRWGTLDKWMAQRDIILKELKLDIRYKDLMDRSATDPEAKRQFDEIVNREIAWAHDLWVKNHTPSENNPLGVYDYRDYAYTRYLVGVGGPLGKNPEMLKFYFSGEYRKNPTRLPTPERNQIYQNYLLNILYHPTKMQKIKLMGMFQKYRGGIWSGSEDIRWSGLAFTPPGVSTKYYVLVDPVRTEQTITQSLNWVYTINSNSFVEATLSHQNEKYELPYEYLAGWATERDRLDSLGDTRGTILKDGIWWDNQYFRPLFNFSTNYYQDNRTEHWSLSVDYTNQLDPTNLFKAGGRVYYWDMVNNGVNSSFQANTYVARSRDMPSTTTPIPTPSPCMLRTRWSTPVWLPTSVSGQRPTTSTSAFRPIASTRSTRALRVPVRLVTLKLNRRKRSLSSSHGWGSPSRLERTQPSASSTVTLRRCRFSARGFPSERSQDGLAGAIRTSNRRRPSTTSSGFSRFFRRLTGLTSPSTTTTASARSGRCG